MVDENQVSELDDDANELAFQCFRTYDLTQRTEFHATDICSGNGNFRRWRDPSRRLEVLKRLATIIDRPDGVYKVAVRLDLPRINTSVDYQSMGFMYLVERVNQFARFKRTKAILIGDYEHSGVVERSVRSLASYRKNGTLYAFGQPINNVVDTVHFAQSHHSRLLQLADALMWFRQMFHRTDLAIGIRADIQSFVRSETSINFDNKYKYWPPSEG